MSERAKRGMRVFLLGPMRVEVDGRAIDVRRWKSKKTVMLFKYLVARLGERVPRDVLVDLLWPNSEDGDRSSHNLHTVIYYLRRTLEPSLGRYEEPTFLRHAHGLYWIDPDAPVWSDAEEFCHLLRQAESLRGHDDERALGLYRRALTLYRDDFCPEDLYEDWAVTVRERFRELHITATLQAANLIVEVERDFSGAVSICRAALAREPYREELHQAIIAHLVKAGCYGEAALQYRACVRLLDEEFGLSPSPETQALYNAMKRLQVKDDETQAGDMAQVRVHADTGHPVGPFLCDRQTYSAIYRLELRRQARTGEPIGLLRVVLGEDGQIGSAQRRAVEASLTRSLRQGDVICWESSRRLVVQLPRTGQDGVTVIRRRLRRALEKLGFAFVSIEDSVIQPDTAARNVETV